jgi:protein SCO1
MTLLRFHATFWTVALVTLFALGSVLADAGDQDHADAPEVGGDAAHGHEGHGPHHTPLPLTSVAADSLYHLAATWTDQHGHAVRLADFRGQPVMITMFYGNCTTACPLLLHRARTLQTDLGVPIPVLAVSFDPETDTPEAMRAYAAQRGYAGGTLGAWSFLSATPSVIRTLATMLGVQYQRRADGHFDHSNLIAVLDADGVVRVRTEGTSPDVSRVVEEVRAAGLLRP